MGEFRSRLPRTREEYERYMAGGGGRVPSGGAMLGQLGQVGVTRPTQAGYMEQLERAKQYASDITGAVGEGGAGEAGEGALGDYIDPTIRAALGSLMEGGMSPEQYDVERAQVTGGFQRALGGLAKATGRKGFYAPHSVAQAAMGGPARALAGGLAGLSAKRAQMKQQSIGQAGQIAASLYGHRAQAETARRQEYLNVLEQTAPPIPSWGEQPAQEPQQDTAVARAIRLKKKRGY